MGWGEHATASPIKRIMKVNGERSLDIWFGSSKEAFWKCPATGAEVAFLHGRESKWLQKKLSAQIWHEAMVSLLLASCSVREPSNTF